MKIRQPGTKGESGDAGSVAVSTKRTTVTPINEVCHSFFKAFEIDGTNVLFFVDIEDGGKSVSMNKRVIVPALGVITETKRWPMPAGRDIGSACDELMRRRATHAEAKRFYEGVIKTFESIVGPVDHSVAVAGAVAVAAAGGTGLHSVVEAMVDGMAEGADAPAAAVGGLNAGKAPADAAAPEVPEVPEEAPQRMSFKGLARMPKDAEPEVEVVDWSASKKGV